MHRERDCPPLSLFFLLYMLMAGPLIHPVGNLLIIGSGIQCDRGVNIGATSICYS